MVSPNKPGDLKFDTMNPQWKDKSTVGEVDVHAHRHVNKTKKTKQGLSLQNTVEHYHLTQFRLHVSLTSIHQIWHVADNQKTLV